MEHGARKPEKDPEEDTKAHYFFLAVENCPHIKTDIDMYNRAEDDGDEAIFCYAFLLRGVERYTAHSRKKGMVHILLSFLILKS